MNFNNYLSSNSKFDAQSLKRLVGEINLDDMIKKVRTASLAKNINALKDDLFLMSQDDKIVNGLFVYKLNGPDERYESDDYDFPEDDYFYIGSFKYDTEKSKVVDVIEDTVNRHTSPLKAISAIKRDGGIQI